ncbi:ATP-binding cassette domain-containing protein [Rhodophyticola sp. CCM32]|uniref:oligopeptide/dipeptide ABC transporter ATP-binding protein n=1 Tax=Rhodophyticola sp. CCM32 TaxID=2916397 RepID=UPI00107FCAF5|nr:oligopeptide/dipeptide ABC transporter ATP-binding protein [Rhodophyticola sp. CCM32]QBX99488.1 ATP-binding cassette domain-containing protein [Rhodophyticola sp. CCM32]
MTAPLLETRDVSVSFDVPRPGAWPWAAPDRLQAVKDASIRLEPGKTLGLVGESGSGKSTLARAVIGTVPVSAGQVLWRGDDVAAMGPTGRQSHGRHVQMVFQDPLAALNPRMNVGQIVAEPLITHFPDLSKDQVRGKVGVMMERVGLLPALVNRYPHEFSGGQCQRIGIARALITEPELVICDEPVSALDVSVQAQVVNLLQDLQRDMGLSLLFIAHDLSVVRHISHRIAVMYLGRIVEAAPAPELIANPRHPYTRALIASVPVPSPKAERARHRPVLEGELPSPLAPPSGCVFRTRCPISQPACAEAVPPVTDIGNDHIVACPYHSENTDAAVV